MADYFTNPSPVNKVTLKRMMDRLPEYQKRKRRAEKLRGVQEDFEAMQKTPIRSGVMAPVTTGLTGTSRAAFDPIGTYVKDYQGISDRIAGGIGSLYAGKHADTAEDELNALRNPEVLESVQQMSQDDPVAASMARSLGIDTPPESQGPEASGVEGYQSPFQLAPGNDAVPSTSEQAQNDGGEIDTSFTPEEQAKLSAAVEDLRAKGIPEDNIEKNYLPLLIAQVKGTPPPQPGSISVTSEPGIAAPETPQPPAVGGVATPTVEQQMAGTLGIEGQDQQPIPRDPNDPTDDTLRAYLGLLDAGDVAGKTKDNDRLFSTIEDKEGNIYQQYAGGKIVKTGLQARAKGVRYQYDEKRNAWIAMDPTYGPSIVGAPPAGIHATTTDGREMTPEEIETARARSVDSLPLGAKYTPEEKSAIAVKEATDKEAEKMKLERQNSAKNALSKTELTSDPGAAAAKTLLTHPGLKKITAGTMGSYADAIGRKDDQGGYSFFGMGALARPILAQNDPLAADALAMIDQIRGSAFATGFQALVGQGAGSISNQEGQGIARALSNLETARTEQALRAALNDYIRLTDSIKARWQREAAGEDTSVPAQTGELSDDDLLKKYGG